MLFEETELSNDDDDDDDDDDDNHTQFCNSATTLQKTLNNTLRIN